MGQQNVKKIDIEKEIEKAMGAMETEKKEPRKTADFKNQKKQDKKEVATTKPRIEKTEAEETKPQLKDKKEGESEEIKKISVDAKPEAKPKPKKIKQKKVRSKKYQELRKRVDRSRAYNLEEGLGLVRQLSKENFDAAIELHMKIKRVKSKAKKAKLNGTIEIPNLMGDQKEVKYQEDKNGNLHFIVGRKGFDPDKLKENAEAILTHLPVGRKQIEKIVISSTMSPGVRINLTKK